MRSGDVSLHERQNTVKSLFEARRIRWTNFAKRISEPASYRLSVPIWLASARIRGEIFIVLVRHILPLISISRIGLLVRDVGPYHRVFTVEF